MPTNTTSTYPARTLTRYHPWHSTTVHAEFLRIGTHARPRIRLTIGTTLVEMKTSKIIDLVNDLVDMIESQENDQP